MKFYREQVDEKYLPDFYQIVDRDFGGDYLKYIDYLYKKSQLMKNGKKIYINKKSFRKDPGVAFGESLNNVYPGALSLCSQAAYGGRYAKLQRR